MGVMGARRLDGLERPSRPVTGFTTALDAMFRSRFVRAATGATSTARTGVRSRLGGRPGADPARSISKAKKGAGITPPDRADIDNATVKK